MSGPQAQCRPHSGVYALGIRRSRPARRSASGSNIPSRRGPGCTARPRRTGAPAGHKADVVVGASVCDFWLGDEVLSANVTAGRGRRTSILAIRSFCYFFRQTGRLLGDQDNATRTLTTACATVQTPIASGAKFGCRLVEHRGLEHLGLLRDQGGHVAQMPAPTEDELGGARTELRHTCGATGDARPVIAVDDSLNAALGGKSGHNLSPPRPTADAQPTCADRSPPFR